MSRFGMTSAVSPDTQAMLALLQDREQTRAALSQRQAEQGQAYDLAQQEMQQRGGLAQQELNQRESQFGRRQAQDESQFTRMQGQQQGQFTEEMAARQKEANDQRNFMQAQQRQMMQWQANQMVASQQHAKNMMQIQLAMATAEGQAKVALEQQYMQAAQAKANIDAQMVAAQAMMGRTQQEAGEVVDQLFRKVEQMETMKKQALDLGTGLAKSAVTLYQSKRTQRAENNRQWRPTSTQPTEGAEWFGEGDGMGGVEDLVAESMAAATATSLKANTGSPRELAPLFKAVLIGHGEAPNEGPLAGKGTIAGEEAAKRLAELGLDPHAMQAMIQTFANTEGGVEAEARGTTELARITAEGGTLTEGLKYAMGQNETDAQMAAKLGIEATKRIRQLGAQGANAFASSIIDTESLRNGLGMVRSKFAGGKFYEAARAAQQLQGVGGAGMELSDLAKDAYRTEGSLKGLARQSGQAGAGAVGAGIAAQGASADLAGLLAGQQQLQNLPTTAPVVP